ncbi:GNAT family N-acetyltransferase [Pedobacter sp.]|jgi:aminoglycoside 6'-N-acetyltransferase I|uniref:GNAT family N-acetyltransferase n=1 Tax=Pedobacter sp. TaxID=1411316 RepID=UPI002D02724B|nr:GNAT family N-acetyltransferase [Pedobacter sp.]HWW42523.1 GNAT family N-acetyltransferase [Pedobacter sp.]
MIIESITRNDIEICAETLKKAYNQAPWNYHWSSEDAVSYLSDYMSQAQFTGFALYHEQELAGAVFAHIKTWWTGKQLYIDELFIAPHLQKKGFGRILIEHMEKYALEQKLTTITLMTHKFMPAMKFYEDINFIHVQPLVILFKPI